VRQPITKIDQHWCPKGVELLPIAEILFEGLEANAPKIVDFDAKWTPDSRAL